MTNQTKNQEHPIDNITRLAKQINSTAYLACTHEDTEKDQGYIFWLLSELAEQISDEATRLTATGGVRE
ncbi:hypothetical protein [Vibrio parahaemolyticus]|uniref:hypothetical protein n=1 Tax=Vibrio parahaemolyticus TaxID=670 RepID=UPI003891C78F